jgi:tRNA A37 methylthiotransferase MiaB
MIDIKKISLIQVNFQQGPSHLNAYYLPYSVGILWSYANQSEIIQQRYRLENVICMREPVDALADRLKNQDVVAFSCYVWNKNYSMVLANKIKQHNPQCQIIFGGPEANYNDPDIFEKHPYIDIIVKNEGEIVFRKILESPEHVTTFPGLVLNHQGKRIDTGPPERISDLTQLPSPYLTGFFDPLIKQHPGIEWNATLETNRGCPYACTFCDWGSLTYNKIKLFDLERVFAEMEWISKHRCGFLSVTDANFGIFPERDNDIVNHFINLQNTYGYPYTFNVSWAKNQKKQVVDIVKKLMSNTNALNHGLTLSFQSFDPVVLDIIKRKNMYTSDTEEIFKLAEQNQVPVNSELILGLPGETLESWTENFWTLFRLGNHSGIDIFQAQLLSNAELNTLQRRLHKIKSTMVYDYMSGSHNNNELAEAVEIIVETATMPKSDMIRAQMINLFINTFHIHGISNWLSRFVHKHCAIDYKDFYDPLYERVVKDPWFKQELDEFQSYVEQWMQDGKIGHPNIAGIEIHGWNLIHRSIINMHHGDKKQHVMELLSEYMQNFNLDQRLIKNLIQLQSSYIIDYRCLRDYPLILELDYNLYDFLTSDIELIQIPETLRLDFTDRQDMLLQEFLEKIYFSRRRNFGKAQIIKINGRIDLDFAQQK